MDIRQEGTLTYFPIYNEGGTELFCTQCSKLHKQGRILLLVYLFIWGFTSLSTLYRSYHDG